MSKYLLMLNGRFVTDKDGKARRLNDDDLCDELNEWWRYEDVGDTIHITKVED